MFQLFSLVELPTHFFLFMAQETVQKMQLIQIEQFLPIMLHVPKIGAEFSTSQKGFSFDFPFKLFDSQPK